MDLGSIPASLETSNPAPSNPGPTDRRTESQTNQSQNRQPDPIGGQTSSTSDPFAVDFPPEAIAALAVQVLDVYCSRRWRMPLSDEEKTGLTIPFTACARKYLSGPISPEYAAAGALVFVMLPRFMAGDAREENASSSDRSEGIGQESPTEATNGRPLDEVSAMLGRSA